MDRGNFQRDGAGSLPVLVAWCYREQLEIESLASRTSSAALQLRFLQNDKLANP